MYYYVYYYYYNNIYNPYAHVYNCIITFIVYYNFTCNVYILIEYVHIV